MTQTDIANLALCKIGESLIDNIDDTGDHRARKAKLHYAPTLREVLRAHFWGFAMGVAGLEKGMIGEPALFVTGSPGYGLSPLALQPLPVAPMFQAADLNGKSRWENDDMWIEWSSGPYAPGSAPVWYFRNETIGLWRTSTQNVATPQEITSWFDSGGDGGNQIFNLDGFELGRAERVGGPPLIPEDSPSRIGWTNAFTLPADFIKLRRVLTVDGDKIEAFDFRRIGGARCLVAGDHDELALEYVQFVDDPADYDPLFVNAFATLLASRLARAISGSDKAEADLRGLYESVDLPAARTADGHDSQSNENRPLREFLAGNLLGPRGDFFPEEP